MVAALDQRIELIGCVAEPHAITNETFGAGRGFRAVTADSGGSGNPVLAVLSLHYVTDLPAGQAIIGCVVRELVAVKDGQALARSEPNVTMRVTHDVERTVSQKPI